MPELPEVEAARRLLTRSAVGRRIVKVHCAPDSIVFQGVSTARIRRALLGRRVAVGAPATASTSARARSPSLAVAFTSGCSGGIEVRGRRRQRLVMEGRRAHEGQWPPRFLKLHLTLDDGGEVAFRDARGSAACGCVTIRRLSRRSACSASTRSTICRRSAGWPSSSARAPRP